MADEKPTIHIDNDWKRQAQEEKKRLVEQEAAKAREAAVTSAPSAASVGVGPAAPGVAKAAAARAQRGENQEASFGTLVQSILTQILFYLGDLAPRGAEPQINLDMAKHQIDILGILEKKTAGNVTEEEKKLLDTALYETRMRYVSVASQYT
ncbi:MAG: DUF1844 domain-containing protein [Planctomycetota bacterium]|nr:DUF1844 domain-containing protein [Planctomycetota bacterium]